MSPAGHLTLLDVPTPALVVDRARLAANTARMSAHVRSLGLSLRPHVKTAKCLEVVRLALAGNAGGITVSTLGEAEWFTERGLRDVVYAVCIAPDRFERAAALARRGVQLGLITDDVDVARRLAAFANAELDARHDAPAAFVAPRLAPPLFDVLVELDVGEHRTGVAPDGEALLDVARTVHAAPGLRLRGVLAHAGHSYACTGPEQVAAVAEDERRLAALAARRLRAAGLPCDVVSVGSTPTCTHARSGEGLTEMRPGVYVFGDVFQAAIGSCAVDDVALSVLATVVSHRPRDGALVLDAGALALSKDTSTRGTALDAGYGLLAELRGARPIAGAHVAEVHQEHGAVRGLRAADLARLPVGARVRVLPNHACLTAAAYERCVVVEGDGVEVVGSWERCTGWGGGRR